MASLLLGFSALICMFSFSPAISQQINTYIVHVSSNADDTASSSQLENLESRYLSFLPKDTEASSDAARLVHSYRNIIKGFAARLSADEAKAMEKMEGVLSVKPQRILSLQTTHSPNFLGLHENFGFWPSSNFGEGVIVGLLDTGITPGHPSFDDEGMPPPPAKWKGKCELDASACNKKLIGARNFVTEDTAQPIDDEGHGTHTASTAAGNFVTGANVFDNANGTAVGMAPRAHLAMYKVCSADGCAEVDMLAAMDAAVEEGVDVLSISIGGPPGILVPFFTDSIAIGAFAAMQKGIFVSCAAGNNGPVNASLSNEAPWILTVGASTLDRNIRATVVLGNNDEFDGESLFQPISFSPNTMLPLVFPGQNGDPNATFCAPGSLNPAFVQGKVVICDRGGFIGRIDKGTTVKLAGGAAMVLANQEVDGDSTLADAHVLPASHVGFTDGQAIKASIRTQTPTATISFKGTVIGIKSAPAVTSFSSRGPSLASPGILKPDIIGPGVSIIAAWNESVEGKINTAANFNIISGTSMATPHLSGIAALLKSAHPDWSPAAIKSAIMTTAELFNINSGLITDERRLPADVFAIGAGHVNPPRAADPGLIYDIQPDDYIPYLCGLGYKNKEITIITQRKVRCSRVKSIPETQLNYPSFSIELGVNAQKTFTRTVTNVGAANSVYRPQFSSIPGVDVDIQPSALSFTEVKQQITYQVTFTRTDRSSTKTFVQGAIIWVSGATRVRSPISVLLT